jgi:hypothetical protein
VPPSLATPETERRKPTYLQCQKFATRLITLMTIFLMTPKLKAMHGNERMYRGLNISVKITRSLSFFNISLELHA